MSKEKPIIIHENQQTMFTDELKEHIEPIVKGITFNNANIVAKALYENDTEIADALLNELTAMQFFNDLKEK